jgi:NAD(P)-dependent dehydrogenase (short-subunit alcohol dehydrogenase family)
MSHGRLENRVVVITGGASGIERASARLFSDEGARVVIADTNVAAGEAVARKIQEDGAGAAMSVETDVADSEQVRQLIDRVVDEFGWVDVLFGNAGILPLGTAWDATVDGGATA